MKTTREFLRLLTEAFPVKAGEHTHVMGLSATSDHALVVYLMIDKGIQTVFLDEGDLERPAQDLVHDIVKELRTAPTTVPAPACVACSIEAEIGTEEDPHPVPKRHHTCVP